VVGICSDGKALSLALSDNRRYCPVIWHTSPPDAIAVFFKTVLFSWVLSIYFLTQGILKKEMAKELASIKHINDSLGQKKFEIKSQEDSIHHEVNSSKDESEKGGDSFSVPLKDGIKTIAFIDIYFIAVEDHYCNFVFNRKGEICKEYVRLSLKEALANLPSSHFAQVHRSYAVNLQHVKHIKKEGQAYQLFIEGSDNFLPASRHRAHTFLPKLKEILN
jgi:DNA-binding LytR/AlgR family response regulator